MYWWFVAIYGRSRLWRWWVFRILDLLLIGAVTHQQKSGFFWGVSFVVRCFCNFNLSYWHLFMSSVSIDRLMLEKLSHFLIRTFWLQFSSLHWHLINQFHPCWHRHHLNCFMRSFGTLLLFSWLTCPGEHALNPVFELPCTWREWWEEAWAALLTPVRFRSE